MINVNYANNQGDAHLLINGDITTMIDAGYARESRKMVVPYLKELGITSIDHFFISHPHKDHYQGMEAIQQEGIAIDNVYYNMPPVDVKDCCYKREHFVKYLNAAKDRGAKLHDIKEGFKIEYSPDSVIEVVYSHTDVKHNGRNIDVNDMSLIMKWTLKDWSILFTGDLNIVVGALLAHDPRMKADILKVPHHGAYGIAPEAFFRNVGSKFNMFPSVASIYHGERGAMATNFTRTNKIPHCVNGINGNVVLMFDDKVNVHSEKPSRYCQNGVIESLRKR